MSTDISVWIAALLTLGLFSFLYKDNPVYKTCEAIFVGSSAGYWAVVNYFDALDKKLWAGLFPANGGSPEYILIPGAILGVLMLFRLLPKIGWISRWPLSFIVGSTAGLYMMIYFVSNGMNQVASTMSIPRDPQTHMIIWSAFPNTLIIMIGVVSGLVYFFFSKPHKGAFGVTAKVGIWFLMATFGAHFGYTVMSRMSLLIGRVDFLFRDWLHLIG
ncbi:MAG: hypothetical protein D6800_02860 [Candidatus Zixiibacteriota bacterium]|nr:MAG: hypothetical protein D6800_02860 [candidate division Zixibacteria bacterium]